MLPWGVAGVMAVSSVVQGMSRNAAISKAASEQAESNLKFSKQASDVAESQLLGIGDEVNNQVGMALTNLMISSSKAQGATVAATAESNAYGNVALRKETVLAVQTALSKDSLLQQAESKMIDIQNKLRDNTYAYQGKSAQISQEYRNSMSQQQSTLELATGAVSAGLQGYTMGAGIASAGSSLMTSKSALNAAQTNLTASTATSNNLSTWWD